MDAMPRLDDAKLPDYLRGLGLLAAGEVARVEPAGDGNINWVRRVAGGRSLVRREAGAPRISSASPNTRRRPNASSARPATSRRCARSIAMRSARPCCASTPTRVYWCSKTSATRRASTRCWPAAATRAASRSGSRVSSARCTPPPRTTPRSPGASRTTQCGACTAITSSCFRSSRTSSRFPSRGARARRDDLGGRPPRHRRARRLRATTSTPRGALVHGDVQAGNVLVAARGAVLLDAEIAHIGDPAFDLGTLFAHLWLPSVARGVASGADAAIHGAWRAYASAATDAGADAAPARHDLRRDRDAAPDPRRGARRGGRGARGVAARR